jgi:CO/xanthine dehydrogenase Mo-binding subunit
LRLASFEAGFDARGRLIAWHHRVVPESVAGYRTRLTGSAPPSIDTIVMKGSSLPQYPIPNKLVEHVVETRGARLSSVRGVGVYDNAFAVESFLDEMAKALGRDPIDFRLDLSELRGHPCLHRHRARRPAAAYWPAVGPAAWPVPGRRRTRWDLGREPDQPASARAVQADGAHAA